MSYKRFRRFMALLALAILSSLVSAWYKGMLFGVPLNLFFQMLALAITILVFTMAVVLTFFEKPDGLQRCIFAFSAFFIICFAWFSVLMFVLLGVVQGFFLFFLGLHVNLLQVVFWNRELFEVICATSFAGAVLLLVMYFWERCSKECG